MGGAVTLKSGHTILYFCNPFTDGHHKLIRWRFASHGKIDGYSHMITYLHCSTDCSGLSSQYLGQTALLTFLTIYVSTLYDCWGFATPAKN